MSTAASLLGMEIIFLGGLTDETFTFEKVHARADWPGVEEGSSDKRSSSLCSRLLDGAPASTANAPDDPHYGSAPKTQELGIVSYVGVPVRDGSGQVVATLCGIDRGSVEVEPETIAVLEQLAQVISAHLGPLLAESVVIRRVPNGGWAVGDEQTGELTSAMVLADLLADDLAPAARPARSDGPLDEVGQLRMSVKQLEHALAARVVVEQAIGVLTERQSSSPRQAFERLRKVARSRGRKVHDLAREIVMSATDPAVPLPPELAGRR
jgi:hypothetical protein